MVVVVLVVVSILELVLLIIGMLSRVVREVSGACLQLAEGSPVILILTLVVLSTLLFIARIVLVGALGLNLGWIASNSLLVMVVIVISATVAAAAWVFIFEIAVVLSLTVFGEIALMVSGKLRFLHLIAIILLELRFLTLVVLLLSHLSLLLVVEVSPVLRTCLMLRLLLIVPLVTLAAAHSTPTPLVLVVTSSVLRGSVITSTSAMTSSFAVAP
jgi:hypothetical protein